MIGQTRELAITELKIQLDEIVDTRGYADGTPGRAKAFEWWIIKNIIGIDNDEEIKKANVGDKGGSDGSGSEWECDFFTILNEGTETEPTTEEEQTIVWGQAKYSEEFNHKFDDASFSRLLRVEERFQDVPDSSNEKFKKAAKNFQASGGEDSRCRKQLLIVVCGDVTKQVKEQVGDPNWMRMNFNSLNGDREIIILDTEEILKAIVLPVTPDVDLKFVESVDDVIMRNDSLQPKNMSIIGHIHGTDLAELWNNVGDTLFLENPRRFLGNKGPTNSEIKKTLDDNQKKLRFWKLNNGITACCNEIIINDDHFHIKNLKIVNGQQTTQSVRESWQENKDNVKGVEIGLKIHVTDDPQERRDISTSTNRQNSMTNIELMDIGGEHSKLHLQCNTEFSKKYYYERQKNSYANESDELKSKVTKRRLVLKGDTAIRFYAYKFNPHDAIKKGKGKIFNTINTNLYQKIFYNKIDNPNSSTSEPALIAEPGKDPGVRDARELIMAHVFHKILEDLGTKIWSRKIKLVKQWIDDGSDPTTDPRIGDEFWMSSSESVDADIKINQRFVSVLSPEHVKYYLLHWIYLSLNSLATERKTSIENEIITTFGNIRTIKHPIPNNLIAIGKEAVELFMQCYDYSKEQNWDKSDSGEEKIPSADFVKRQLAKPDTLINLLSNRITIIAMMGKVNKKFDPDASGDAIRDALEGISPTKQ